MQEALIHFNPICKARDKRSIFVGSFSRAATNQKNSKMSF